MGPSRIASQLAHRRLQLSFFIALVSCALGVALATEVPTGVVVKNTYTLAGDSFVVEWLPPRCVNQVLVYYSFEVVVFSVEQIRNVGQDNLDEYANQTITTHAQGTGVLCMDASETRAERAVSHKVTGLAQYESYLVGVKSREMSSDVLSAMSPKVPVTPGITPKGSGEEQVAKGGLAFDVVAFKNDWSCQNIYMCTYMGFGETEAEKAQFDAFIVRNMLAFDADGDGDMDVLLVNGFKDESCPSCQDPDEDAKINFLLKNNGTGWFERPGGDGSWPQTKSNSRAAVAGDFDGDGSIDVFIVNSGEPNELVLNDGEGKVWTTSTNAGDAITLLRDSRGVVAGDFDGDGDLDLYIVNFDAKNELYFNDGAGQFTAASEENNDAVSLETFGTGALSTVGSVGVVTADFNGDGHLDLFEITGTIYSANMPSIDRHNILYLNDGNGVFQQSQSGEISTTSEESNGVVTGDFDGDGDIDIYVVNDFSSKENELYINDGLGTFTKVPGGDATKAASSSQAVVSCDIDGDGDLDIYIRGGPNVLLLNDGTGNFSAAASDVLANYDVLPWAPPLCFDATGNGQMDLWSSKKALQLNKGNWPHTEADAGDAARFSGTTRDVQVLDADNDGDMDLLFTTNVELMLLLNDGTGHFVEQIIPTRFEAAYSSVILDINGDGHSDIFVSNSVYGSDSFGSTKNEILLGDGEGNFEMLSASEVLVTGIRQLTLAPSTFALADDFNGDGFVDLYLLTFHVYTRNSIWLNDGTGKFEGTDITTRVGESRRAVAIDVDMDGDLDIFNIYYGEACELLINDGSGSFQSSADFGEATSRENTWNSVVAADFDGDGAVDLYVGSMGYDDKDMLLLSNGDGTFALVEQQDYLWNRHYFESYSLKTPGYQYIGLDIDGDGDVDLLGVGFNNQHSNMYLNDGSASFKVVELDLISVSQEAMGFAAGDFDGDGDLDVFYFTGQYHKNRLFLTCGTGYSLLPGTSHCVASSFKPELSGVSPDSADTSGQGLALIQGRFGADPKGSVAIDGNSCKVSSQVSLGLWICEIPPGSSTNLEVKVENYGHVGIFDAAFSYKSPMVDQIQPQFISSSDEDLTFTIQGSNFGSFGLFEDSVRNVTIGGEFCSILASRNHSHTYIECEMVPDVVLPAGVLEVLVTVGDQSDSTKKVCRETELGSSKCLCPAGKEYQDEECVPCGANHYSDGTECISCPLGSVIPLDVDTATDSGSCVCGGNAEMNFSTGRCECSAGYGGDATVAQVGCTPCGTGAFKGAAGNIQCTACPSGSSIPGGETTATSSDSCACGSNAEMNSDTGRCECSAGYGGDATVLSIGCTPCGAYSYKQDVGNTGCTPCALGAGISGGVSNATDPDSCECHIRATLNLFFNACECLPGYGGDATNSNVGCSACGNGAFKEAAGNTQCTACPLGSSISDGDTMATSSDSCVCGGNAEMNLSTERCECSAGYGGDATILAVGCSPCGASGFKVDAGNRECAPCPAGAMISDGLVNATNAESCSCPLHSTLNSDTERCECNAGYGGDGSKAFIGCSVCGTSAFKGDIGNTQCTSCPSGSTVRDGVTATSIGECFCDIGTVTIGNESTTVSCQCAPGYFGSSLERNCELCPVGEYKDKAGDAVTCIPCTSRLGEGASTLKQGSLSKEDCVCGNGYYMDEEMCMPCEIGASCPGGDISSMVALPGFWRLDPTSTAFFSCESPNGYSLCMGGAPTNQTGGGASASLCREGHEGLLCSKCMKGYGKTYGVCTKCNSSFNASGVFFVLFAILAFLALLFGLVSNNLRKATECANSKEKESIALSVVKIVINWLQMASIAAQVRVSTNESMERFFQLQDVSNVSPFQFSSFNCMVQTDYYAQFYAALAIPPVCVVLGLCLTCIHFLRKSTKSIRFWDLFVMVSQMLWFFTYSMVSQILLGIFECRNLDRGVSVLSADLSVQCETSKHNSAVKLGYIFGLLYIVGIPLQVFAQLYRYRGNLEDRSVRVRFMFLFHNYREGLYWYECINMLRKIGLVTALVLLQEDLGTQVFALSVLSMTYLTLHAYIKPYTSQTLNELETGALFVTALTLSMCSFFYSNPTGTGNPVVEQGLTWSVIVLSICLLLCSLLLIGKGGLVAFKHGKLGEESFQLPSNIAKAYRKNEDAEHCVGSPSQSKSLLCHDEENWSSASLSSGKRIIMTNPLSQSQDQKGETGELPRTMLKDFKFGSNLDTLDQDVNGNQPTTVGENGELNSLTPGKTPAVSNPLYPEILDLDD